MAITGAQLQAALGTNPLDARVLREYGVYGTQQHWLVAGNRAAQGRVRFCRTTESANAATQANEVLQQLRA